VSAAPWSELVRLSDLGRGPDRRVLTADEAARARVAEALGVEGLPELSAEIEASRWLDGAVVRGTWTARVVQICGVTLDPFESALSGDFEVRAVPPGSPMAVQDVGNEIELDLNAADPPDVLEDERLDLAGYVVEHLALELDPFPRKPGVEFEPPEAEPETSPFAALLQLKPRA
jgi:uncharacterized metal-binding protein YceD (DUF177 family)